MIIKNNKKMGKFIKNNTIKNYFTNDKIPLNLYMIKNIVKI